jgi:two-component system response regulator NreC
MTSAVHREAQAAPGQDEQANASISVMVAEGQAIVRTALVTLLHSQHGIKVVAAPEGSEATVDAARRNKPDVILFDPLPPIRAAELEESVGRIHAASPDSKLMVVSDCEEALPAQAALRAGAVGYILKSDEAEDLLSAVKRAARGEPWISPQVALAIASIETGGDDELTEREFEVVRLVALGYTNKEMAELMHVSVRTVESHRARILTKLGATTRSQVVRYALDHEMIS